MTDADLGGTVVLVTGSTDGIGREIARRLAGMGATVLFHGRDREKGERAVETVVAETGNEDLDLYCADFTDFDAVRDLAAAVAADHGRLDVLVNNAGTWQGERRLVDVPGSDEGIELTFAVNHLAPFLLTHYLVEALATAGETANGEDDPARVVTVASSVHRRATMDLDAVRGPEGLTGVDAYAVSKLANVMFTAELARRLPESVTANSCHPGIVPRTAIDRGSAGVERLGWNLLGHLGRVVPGVTTTPEEAAETPVFLASSPRVAGVTGRYFSGREPATTSAEARDRAKQRRLWSASADLVALSDDVALPEPDR